MEAHWSVELKLVMLLFVRIVQSDSLSNNIPAWTIDLIASAHARLTAPGLLSFDATPLAFSTVTTAASTVQGHNLHPVSAVGYPTASVACEYRVASCGNSVYFNSYACQLVY